MTDEKATTGNGSGEAAARKPATTVTAGTLIMGTYEIERLINSGGMGEVYRGHNIHNGEPVAIKIVLPALAHDQKIVALFQKESTVLSRLAHEAIVRYHVFTNDPTIGRPCMVMEFVEGTALSDRIEKGPMPLDEVKVMLRRVASGLDKAHRAGVVHRDLSPDNVILEDGLVEHAKLIDFGIAKSSNFGSGTLLQGQFAGKFNWVSPEQLGAFGGQVDGRSDIYSLGLILAGASRGQVLPMGASIVDAVSKRASVPDLQGVDPELAPLLRWMLEPDPARRVDSMGKVIAALDAPSLIPVEAPQGPALPDPNRTVIEPLPVAVPVDAAAPPAVRVVTAAPVDEVTGNRTVALPLTAPPSAGSVAADEPLGAVEDASPFGAPAGPAPARPAIVKEPAAAGDKGKGGLIGILAVLAIAAGGAGAYFGGVFNSDPVPGEPAQEETAKAEPATPAPEPLPEPEDQAAQAQAEAERKAAAEAEALAAAEAAAKAEADEKAASEAAAKAAADSQAAAEAEAAAKAAAEVEAAAAAEAAAKAAAETAAEAEAETRAAAETQAATAAAAEARAQAEAAGVARAEADTARAEAEKAASEAESAASDAASALADAASAAAEAARAAAVRSTAAAAASAQAAEAAGKVPAAAGGMSEVAASAAGQAAAARDSAAGADAAAGLAARSVQANREKEAARLAEEKARQEAEAADPVVKQQAYFDTLGPEPCLSLRLIEAKAEGFSLVAMAPEALQIDGVAHAWTAATGIKPEIAAKIVTEAQCAALAFASAHQAGKPPVVTLVGGAEAFKSGTAIEGVITGLDGRPFALLVIGGAGATINLKDFVTVGPEGDASFKVALQLVEGQAATPHVLLAITADAAHVAMLEGVKPGTKAGGERGLLPFLDQKLAETGVSASVGLGYFMLEKAQ